MDRASVHIYAVLGTSDPNTHVPRYNRCLKNKFAIAPLVSLTAVRVCPPAPLCGWRGPARSFQHAAPFSSDSVEGRASFVASGDLFVATVRRAFINELEGVVGYSNECEEFIIKGRKYYINLTAQRR